MRSFVILVPLTMYKYHYYAFETKTTSGLPTSESLTIGNKMPRATMNDIVSKNITMVLENLLMNYENNQLPTHGKGKKNSRVCVSQIRLIEFLLSESHKK